MRAPYLDVPPVVTEEERAAELSDRLEDFLLEVGEFFPRADLRRRAQACVRGLLAPLSRKNGWQLAEHAGDLGPWNQQHLLSRAVWDEEVLRDFTRRYVVAGLDDGGRGPGPGGCGVLAIDETGVGKKGKMSAGVARRYCGALGGVFPCQVAVVAAWATSAGQALIDRALYLPREWAGDRERRCAAGVPGEVGFSAKPRLARDVVARALPDLPDGRVRVTADEVYGCDGAFRAFLEQCRIPYAVAVRASQGVLPRPGWRHVGRLVERCAAEEDWLELPAGGEEEQELGPAALWQWWVRRVPDPDAGAGEGSWARWIIARRRDDSGEHDYYLGWGPEKTEAGELVRVPAARWSVEEAIKLGKSACGMADYEVRSWRGWHRHMTLAQLAAAFLAVQRAEAAREPGPPAERGGPCRTRQHRERRPGPADRL